MSTGQKPYVIVRIDAAGQGSVVHSADTIKDARYWLSYIAMPGDALFQTPAHPKYKGAGGPQYTSHLVARGKIEYDENKWRQQVADATTSAIQLPSL